jgi:hypothetical protein
MQRVLDDRLLLSEAIELVGKLVRAYPNGGANADRGYIGTLASVLCEFPKQVALRCVNPIHGVSRETKFLPTVADLVGWLERETEPLRKDVDRELRVARQIEAREQWQNEIPTDRLKEMGKAWLDRTDPVAHTLASGAADPEIAKRQASLTAQIEQANQRVFERECKAAGVDPARGISPELLKSIGGR